MAMRMGMPPSTRSPPIPEPPARPWRHVAGTGAAAGRGGAVAALSLALSVGCLPRPVAADFVYDLSSRLIAITTAFAGTQVLLYGAAPTPGHAIAVVVRGPARDTTVRRKTEVGPIWINTQAVEFKGVPSFYALAASVPLAELAGPGILARHELGADNLKLVAAATEGYDPAEIAVFRAALVRVKQRAGLFSSEPGLVSFLGDTLFRTRVTFPANVPPGLYQVQVLQFAGGEVVGAQSSTLEVAKMGVEATLFDFATSWPALYALASIALALAAGWSANALFRKP